MGGGEREELALIEKRIKKDLGRKYDKNLTKYTGESQVFGRVLRVLAVVCGRLVVKLGERAQKSKGITFVVIWGERARNQEEG